MNIGEVGCVSGFHYNNNLNLIPWNVKAPSTFKHIKHLAIQPRDKPPYTNKTKQIAASMFVVVVPFSTKCLSE